MSKKPFYEIIGDAECFRITRNCFAFILEIGKTEPDPVSKFIASMRLKEDAFRKERIYPNTIFDNVREDYLYAIGHFPKYNALLNDLWEYFLDNNEITPLELDKLDDVFLQYLDFKRSVDIVPEDVSKEVERMAEMSDEEFEAEMAKEDDDAKEEDNSSDEEGGEGADEEADGDTRSPDAEVTISEAKPGDSKGIPVTIINPKK